jgi:hypothetical protein
MAYALESLMKIRVRREDAARSELTAARLRMSEAQNELDARKEEFRLYEETKDERRDRIYAAILGLTLRPDELEMAREGVSRIDEEGNLKADNIVRAEGVLRNRAKEVETAREGFVFATKNRMKIDEHRNNWLMDEVAEDNRRQEIELEDFTGKKVALFATSGGSDITKAPDTLRPLMKGEIIGAKRFEADADRATIISWMRGIGI